MKVMNSPRSVELAITNQCNLRCKYCSHFSSAGDVDHDLPKDEWLSFFEELNRCQVMNITLQGGEPFYRDDLHELIEGIVRNRMRFSILSNGTLIDDEMAAFLTATGRCDGVQVSIDGSSASIHDANRGKGSFQQAIAGIECLRKNGVNVSVRVTIHKQNVRDIEAIAKLLLDDLRIPNFSTNAASYMGLCRSNAEMVQLTVEERSFAMESMLRLRAKYNGRVNATAGPLYEVECWLRMEKARRNGSGGFSEAGYLTACRGFLSQLAIRADGVIVPCIQIPHIELGRINRDDFCVVWRNNSELNRLRERRAVPLSEFEFCNGCEYMDYCTGGCPALAYTLTGLDFHPSPDACLKRFLEAGGRLPEEKILDGAKY